MFSFTVHAQQHTLTVHVNGVEPNEGMLMTALYGSDSTFLNIGNFTQQRDMQEEDATTFTFENIPAREYAISVIQDLNYNGELDMGMFGPTEPYGFSNNARGWFGPPSFEDASFELNDDKELTIEIK